MSPQLATSMRDELKAHRVSGATIHFSPDNLLPRSLVKTIRERGWRKRRMD